MEHIIRESIYPQTASPIPRSWLSLLFLIPFIIIVGFALVIAGVRAAAQYVPHLPNPFPAYADIYPGQPMSAIEARAFSCHKDYDYLVYNHIKCTFTPPQGVFSRIDAIVSKGIILQVSFNIRDNTLNVGDIDGFLEMATVHWFYHTAYFLLPTSLVRAETIGHGDRFSLFLPVWSVTFMELS